MKKTATIIFFVFVSITVLGQNEPNEFRPSRLSFRLIPSFYNWSYKNNITRTQILTYEDGRTSTEVFKLPSPYRDKFNRNGGGIKYSLFFRAFKKFAIGIGCELEVFGVYFNRGGFFEFPDMNSLYNLMVEYQPNRNLHFQIYSGREYGPADDVKGFRNGLATILLMPEKNITKGRLGLKLAYEFKRATKVENEMPKIRYEYSGLSTIPIRYIDQVSYKTKANSHFIKVGLFVLLQGKRKIK